MIYFQYTSFSLRRKCSDNAQYVKQLFVKNMQDNNLYSAKLQWPIGDNPREVSIMLTPLIPIVIGVISVNTDCNRPC